MGLYIGQKPKTTITVCFMITLACMMGFVRWDTENRPEKLWVPQNTQAEIETNRYNEYFVQAANAPRFNSLLVSGRTRGENILTKDHLTEVLKVHEKIQNNRTSTLIEMGESEEELNFLDLCPFAGGTCRSSWEGVCQCLLTSLLRQWNYDLKELDADDDVLAKLNEYGSREDLEAILGNPVFDDNDAIVSAEAFRISYFLEGRAEVVAGSEVDPVNEAWESDVFLTVAKEVNDDVDSKIKLDFFAGRSFSDEFGEAITGDLALVNISYVMVFMFLGATMGKITCGIGSRWTLALGALITVGISTASGFGVSSALGLFFGPVHSLLPFILLGIGVDDAFVIVNAMNRERLVPRSAENNAHIQKRTSKALARAGASITVTSATDLVAFAISSSSRLPALASFCAWSAISITFLWFYASTCFTSTLVLDERRQRDNRRECFCCLTRKSKPENENDVEEEEGFEENAISRYFRHYHGPAILSKAGKTAVLLFFSGLLAFGLYGTFNLSVEDTTREFIPSTSYLKTYLEANDEYFPNTGIDVYFVFEDSYEIFMHRRQLAKLGQERLSGLSSQAPYIAEPVSEEAYRNVITGFHDYLEQNGAKRLGNVELGSDNFPVNHDDFVSALRRYASWTGPGNMYARDVMYDDVDDNKQIEAIRVKAEYVRLTKVKKGTGDIIDDSDRQIQAMDKTRQLALDWYDLPPVFVYSEQFINVESFKIIQKELYQNVGLAIFAVAVIVLITVASPVTAALITLAVACCIIEILGFMFALGIAIDSVSVINIVLAIGLSVDYSAHVGHCFMVKGGHDRNRRALEALTDIGAAVLQGAISTFLAVLVLLFSKSYVFMVLSKQFALTVGLGVLHGLVLLPVLLSIFGPKPFESAEEPIHVKQLNADGNATNDGPASNPDFTKHIVPMDETAHKDNSSEENEP